MLMLIITLINAVEIKICIDKENLSFTQRERGGYFSVIKNEISGQERWLSV